MLEHRVVLGDLHRVIGGDQSDRGRKDDALGPRRDEGEQGRRRGVEERRIVVLADREDVQARLIGMRRHLDDRVDPLALARCAPGRRIPADVADGEDPELHVLSSNSQGCPPCADGLAVTAEWNMHD